MDGQTTSVSNPAKTQPNGASTNVQAPHQNGAGQALEEKNIASILLAEKLIAPDQYDRLKTESVNRNISIDRALFD